MASSGVHVSSGEGKPQIVSGIGGRDQVILLRYWFSGRG